MKRIYNFSAGPATIPTEVLAQAHNELLDWHGNGMSIMEMSHRSKAFMSAAKQAEQDLRELLSIPSNYHVLFLQGGAQAQFSLIPMNLLAGKTTTDYITTGMWSAMAAKEAARYCDVNVAASSEDSSFTAIPGDWQLNADAAYVHYCDNETVHGVEFSEVPDTGDVPLVSDMSSNILSRPLDVSKYGLIYAGAQKNIGPAGVTIVIVRDDLVGHAMNATPRIFDYQLQADKDSMANTPPTLSWYFAGLGFKWLKAQGGVEAIAKVNQAKADRLYSCIDSNDFYSNPVDPQCRSRMNVVFTLRDESLNDAFLKQALDAGLANLKGHRSVGGMRASIYNAMPMEGVEALVAFMHDFAVCA